MNSLLKQERTRRGWSRPSIEKETGIPQRSLENWEDGDVFPREDNIIALCRLYGKTREELGFGKSRDIIGSQKRTVYAPQEEEDPMSDLIRRHLFSNLGSRLFSLVDTWPKRNYRYEELQSEINKAIFDHHALIQQDSITELSRREALKSMALVPVQLIGGVAIRETAGKQKTDTDILLKHLAVGITVCWYLRRGKDLSFVSDLTSSYISILTPLVNSHSEVHHKASATLLAQSFMLKSHLGSEGNLAFTERAVYYGDLSQDPTTQALAYRRRAIEHKDAKNYQDALADAEKGYALARSNKAIHPIIHSITAAGLSLCQAAYGKTDDAKESLAEARTLFDPSIPVAPMSYSESILIAVSGGIYRRIGLWGEATTAYEKSLNTPDVSALGAIEQRIAYAKTEVSRDDVPRNMDLCVVLLTEAITRAEELDSKEFIRKAGEAYDLLRIAWPREDAIKTLGRDHFGRV